MSTPTTSPHPSDRSEILGIRAAADRARGRVSRPGGSQKPTWEEDRDQVRGAPDAGRPLLEPDLDGAPRSRADSATAVTASSSLPDSGATTPSRHAERERMLDELARRVARRGFGIAYDLLKNREQAEDAVQEALARACEHAGRIREPAALDGWFFRVLTNLCLRVLRRRRVRRFFLGERADQDGSHAEPVTHARPADLEVAHARAVAQLLDALDHVPGKQRVALLLRYGHDLSIAEIADMLGVRKATVKTHLVRGLERLRKSMESRP